MRIETLQNAFRGRASRMRFWLVLSIVLPSYLALLLIFWFYALSVPGAYENGGPTPLPSGPLGVLGMIVYFAALLTLTASLFAIAVRRLHDRDKSGWWALLFLAAPNLLTGFAQSRMATQGSDNVGDAVLLLFYAGWALLIWGLVEMGFLPGTKGGNRFGPDPLAQ